MISIIILLIIIIIIIIIIIFWRTQNGLGHVLRNIVLKFIVFVSLVNRGFPKPSSYVRIV